jgi:hypothetical protein
MLMTDPSMPELLIDHDHQGPDISPRSWDHAILHFQVLEKSLGKLVFVFIFPTCCTQPVDNHSRTGAGAFLSRSEQQIPDAENSLTYHCSAMLSNWVTGWDKEVETPRNLYTNSVSGDL